MVPAAELLISCVDGEYTQQFVGVCRSWTPPLFSLRPVTGDALRRDGSGKFCRLRTSLFAANLPGEFVVRVRELLYDDSRTIAFVWMPTYTRAIRATNTLALCHWLAEGVGAVR